MHYINMCFKNVLMLSMVCSVLINVVSGKLFTKCELVKELKKQNFPQKQLADWFCLIDSESNGLTDVKGGPNTDGSYDWGLFQINDRYWCGSGFTGGACNINCDSLLTDDIKIASRCAKKIYKVHGFSAWVGWKNFCQGSLPDISHCI